jgi:hypothetical protein
MDLKALLKRYTVDQLKEAIRLRFTFGRFEALEAKRNALLMQVAKIDKKLAKLNGDNESAGSVAKAPVGPRRRKRWKLSAETRAKMSLAAKRRYASKGPAEEDKAPGKKKRRRMSAEARARMKAAAIARWKKIRGETAQTEPKPIVE